MMLEQGNDIDHSTILEGLLLYVSYLIKVMKRKFKMREIL